MLVVEQPDGTLVLVPEWMTTPTAAAMEIWDTPRLPLSELRALRQVADVALSLLSKPGNGVRHEIPSSFSAARVVLESGTEDLTAIGGDAANTVPVRAAPRRGGSLRSFRDGADR
jgi:hypothetical protein